MNNRQEVWQRRIDGLVSRIVQAGQMSTLQTRTSDMNIVVLSETVALRPTIPLTNHETN